MTPSREPLQFYSEPLPGVETGDLHGKLIVIEGPDAVGRSTQVGRLKKWLEDNGHAVLDTGMARSALAGKGIQRAKNGNTFGPVTMTLFYTTDFADRLENEIVPA
ncbi:MAG: thymidylate kinase, partial [Bryobacteraceae bacterium]